MSVVELVTSMIGMRDRAQSQLNQVAAGHRFAERLGGFDAPMVDTTERVRLEAEHQLQLATSELRLIDVRWNALHRARTDEGRKAAGE